MQPHVWVTLLLGAAGVTALAAALVGYVQLWIVSAAVVTVAGLLTVSWIARRSERKQLFRDDLPKPHLIPELVLLPTVVSIRQSNTVTLALLAVLAVAAAARSYSARPESRMAYLSALMLLGCAAIIFRSGPYIILAVFFAAGLVLLLLSAAVSRADAYASLLVGLSLYLFANIAGWMLGIQSRSSATRIGGYESSAGIFGDRVFFPFSRAINESSYVAAALIVAVAAMIKIHQRPQWYHWGGAAAAAVVLLAANSRTPLLLAVLVTAAILAVPRSIRAAAPYLVGAALLLPFLLQYLQPVLRWFAGVVASSEYLARGQDFDQIMGLGTRDVIWASSIRFWNMYVPSTTNQLIGYGYNGHAESGASAYYSDDIGGFLADRTTLTMHNSVLQTLFDGGLVCAAALFLLVVWATLQYRRESDLLPMLVIVIMLGLSAAAEVSLAPGLSQTPGFLLLYLLVFIPVRNSAIPPSRVARSTTNYGSTSA